MITTAVKRTDIVYVYGDNGRFLFSLACGPNCELLGYTSNTVTLRKGDVAYTYNDKGAFISTTLAR